MLKQLRLLASRFFVVFLIAVTLFAQPMPAQAMDGCSTDRFYTDNLIDSHTFFSSPDSESAPVITFTDLEPGEDFTLYLKKDDGWDDTTFVIYAEKADPNGEARIVIDENFITSHTGSSNIEVKDGQLYDNDDKVSRIENLYFEYDDGDNPCQLLRHFSLYGPNHDNSLHCGITVNTLKDNFGAVEPSNLSNSCYSPKNPTYITVSTKDAAGTERGANFRFNFTVNGANFFETSTPVNKDDDGHTKSLQISHYLALIFQDNPYSTPVTFTAIIAANSAKCQSEPITFQEEACTAEQLGTGSYDDAGDAADDNNDFEGEIQSRPYQLCEQIHNEAAKESCKQCSDGLEPYANVENGIWTAIGCVDTKPTSIIQSFISIGLGMGGGVAMLMIMAAGFKFSISQGDPKRTSDAKEMMTSAVIGLLFVIFSITLLQFIGVSILRIPGFGE